MYEGDYEREDRSIRFECAEKIRHTQVSRFVMESVLKSDVPSSSRRCHESEVQMGTDLTDASLISWSDDST